MSALDAPEPLLVKRLLADAEGKAAQGRIREGFILLRWASRLAPRSDVPLVLLTYHRLRAVGEGHAGKSGRRVIPDRGAAPDGRKVPPASGVTADALGFPVPRFPTRAPDLDRTAFVPAPRRADEVRPVRARPPRSDRGRHRRLDWRMPVLIVAITLGGWFAAGPLGTRYLAGWMHTVRGDPADAADEALRAGEPARALALTQNVADPGPRVLLIRGRAEIVLGDTAAGCAALRTAAAHPQADAAQAWEAAEVLARVRGKEDAAAEAYLRAFSLGLPTERWEVVARALDRAGRHQQAGRVHTLIAPGMRLPPP